MADAVVSKTTILTDMWVRLPPGVQDFLIIYNQFNIIMFLLHYDVELIMTLKYTKIVVQILQYFNIFKRSQ